MTHAKIDDKTKLFESNEYSMDGDEEEKKTTRNGVNTNTSENDHKIWKEKPLRRKGKTHTKKLTHTKETSAREKREKSCLWCAYYII